MIVRGGYTNYGEAIGILMLDTKFPRLVGDVGNALTFPFPVKFKIVKNASPERIVRDADVSLLKPFIEAAQELESQGVKAITTSCGCLAIFQQEMASSVSIPMFTSSLLQIPFVYNVIGRRGKIGIITAKKDSVTKRHFEGAGIGNVPLAITGMDQSEEFAKVFMNLSGVCSQDSIDLDLDKCRKEVQNQALQLVNDNPDVRAIVIECTNLAPFSKDVQEITQMPVFDILTLVKYVYSSVEGLL